MNSTDTLIETFVRLSALTPDERAGELTSIRDRNPALAEELESLLAAHDASPDFLDHLDAEGAVNLLQEDERLLMPERAGNYRLIREIGRGGLGVVYLAERVGGDFEQRVAIKLIKHGMDSEAILRRFHNERRIVASLQHDNIARLIDGGLLDDGRPWFAMEYVEGEPITAWCDHHRLGTEQRLKLFEQVCRAVQYAHSRLIIHRDLKPDNILVTEDGKIKLLDFGIAKLLAESEDDQTQLTLAGIQAMTPEYAAPEQIRGEPVSVETDVYALGVVLYQLLTGMHPFGHSASTREELTDAVCNTTPPLPSSAVMYADDPSIGRRGGPRRRVLRRQLRGDLDSIVLTAMAKDPRRRYGSAEALAEDTRRFLSEVPIRARQRTTVYMVNRFIARHRIGLGAMTAVVLALVTGMSVALWQADKARKEAETSTRVAEFLGDLFMRANPEQVEGSALTALELLDQGAGMIAETFPDEPRVRSELQHKVGAIYADFRLPQKAGPLLEAALKTRQDLFGPDHPDTLHVRHTLGVMAYRDGKYETAADHLETTRQTLDRTEPGSPRLASALNMTGMVKKRLGQYHESIADYERAVEIYRRGGEEQKPDLARVLNNLGIVYYEMSRFDEAIDVYRDALAIHEAVAGPDHPLVAGTLLNLADARRRNGDMEGVEAELRRALEIVKGAWGHDHPSTALHYGTLARTLGDLGKLDEAEKMQNESLAIRRRVMAPDHPYTAYNLNSLGHIYLQRGDPDGAMPYFQEALAVREKAYGPEHVDVADSIDALSMTLVRAERLDEALEYAEQALAIRRKLMRPDDLELLDSIRGVVELRAATGACESSRSLMSEVPDADTPDPSPRSAKALGVIDRYCNSVDRPAESD